MNSNSPSLTQATFVRDLPHQVIWGILQPLYFSLSAIVIKQTLDGSDWEVASVHSAMMAGLLFSLFYAEWGKNHNPVPWIIIPQGISRLSFLFILWMTSSRGFTMIICLGAFLNALSLPLIGMIYQRNYPLEERGRIVGKIKQWALCASVLSAWGIGHFMEKHPFSFQWLYPSLGMLGILGLLWFSGVPYEKETQIEKRKLRDVPRILREDRNFTIFLILQFAFGVFNLAGTSVLHLYVNKKEYLGCSVEEAALLTGVIPPLAMLLTVAAWGKFYDRVPFVPFRALTIIVMALGFAIYAIYPSALFVALGGILWGVGRGGGNLAWTLGVFAFAPKGKVSLYLGINTFLTGVRGIFAPFIGVYFLSAGWSPQEYFTLAASLMCVFALMMIPLIKLPALRQ